MLMGAWASNEIKLAKEEADSFGKACLDSAFNMYSNLMVNNHSGYSVGLTTEIIKRLLEHKPLTPIKDIPENWMKLYSCDEYTHYQCKRMLPLFKKVYKDGRVVYNDIDRVFAVDISTGDTTRTRFAYEILDKLCPIEMPYYPPLGYFKIYYDRDIDTGEIICRYLIDPGGNKVTLEMSVKEI